MTVDYHKHDQEVTLMATVPDAVSLCECMNTYPVTLYAAVNLANAFFSVPAHKDHRRQLTFSCQGQQHTFTILPQGFLNSPSLCHNLLLMGLDCLYHKIHTGPLYILFCF